MPVGRSLVPPGADSSLRRRLPPSMSHLKLALESKTAAVSGGDQSADDVRSSFNGAASLGGSPVPKAARSGRTPRGEISRSLQRKLGDEIRDDDKHEAAHQMRRKRLLRRSMSADPVHLEEAKEAIQAARASATSPTIQHGSHNSALSALPGAKLTGSTTGGMAGLAAARPMTLMSSARRPINS